MSTALSLVIRQRTLLALLPATLVVAGCAKEEKRTAETAADSTAVVQVAAAEAAQVPIQTEVSGTVRAIERAVLAAKLMGAIEELPVTLGQRVKSGDVLVKIAAADVSARVTDAKTQLAGARRDLERERGLLATGATTAVSVRDLEDRVASSEARLREAEAMLGYAQIRAPFDGVVVRKPANTGDLASPGTPLLEVHGEGRFEVEAAVPESVAAKLVVGGPVHVTVAAADQAFAATIAEISAGANDQARATLIKVAVPAGVPLRSGQFARLLLPGPSRTAVLVPATAVTLVGQMERVFVVTQLNRAVLRLVKSGPRFADRVELLAGVQPGDHILVNPPAGLRDGQRVTVRQ